MQTNIWPMIIQIIQFLGLNLSQRDMLRITGVTHGGILKVLYHVHVSSSYAATLASIEDDHIKIRPFLLHMMRW